MKYHCLLLNIQDLSWHLSWHPSGNRFYNSMTNFKKKERNALKCKSVLLFHTRYWWPAEKERLPSTALFIKRSVQFFHKLTHQNSCHWITHNMFYMHSSPNWPWISVANTFCVFETIRTSTLRTLVSSFKNITAINF